MSWTILFFANVFEVAGTLILQITEGMTRLWPTVLMVAVLGVFWLKEEVTVLRSASMLLIVMGVAGLYLTGSHQ